MDGDFLSNDVAPALNVRPQAGGLKGNNCKASLSSILKKEIKRRHAPPYPIASVSAGTMVSSAGPSPPQTHGRLLTHDHATARCGAAHCLSRRPELRKRLIIQRDGGYYPRLNRHIRSIRA